MTHDEKMREIREALEKITQTKWLEDERTVYALNSNGENLFFLHLYHLDKKNKEECDANAIFIAAAPDYVRFLLSEVDRLEKENIGLSGAADHYVKLLTELQADNATLIEQNKKLVDANMESFNARADMVEQIEKQEADNAALLKIKDAAKVYCKAYRKEGKYWLCDRAKWKDNQTFASVAERQNIRMDELQAALAEYEGASKKENKI